MFSSPYPGYYLSMQYCIIEIVLCWCFRPLIRGITYLCNRGQGKEKRELKFSSPYPGYYLSMYTILCYTHFRFVFVPLSGVLLIYPVLGIPCKYWTPIADCGACHNLQ